MTTTYRLQPPDRFRRLYANDAMLVLAGPTSETDLYCLGCHKPASTLNVGPGPVQADGWPSHVLLTCGACGTAIADLGCSKWDSGSRPC